MMLQVEIAKLIGAGVAGLTYDEATDAGNIFVDMLPTEPDRAVAVLASGGDAPDSKLPYDSVEIQVVVRSDVGGAWARTIWEAIYDVLHGARNQALADGTWMVSCLAGTAGPVRLGPDATGRPAYSTSYRVEARNTTSERS